MEKDINIFQDDEEEDNNNIEKNDKIILKNSRLSKFYNKNERLNELEHSNIALGNSINESESHSHYLYIENLSYFIKFYIILYNFNLFSDLIVEKK